MKIKVIKKDGTFEDFNSIKIISAIEKSADRCMINISDTDKETILNNVLSYLTGVSEIEVSQLHNMVESSLESVNQKIAKSYRDYRNYKKDFVGMLDEVYNKAQKIMYLGDKDNSNTDSALVTTKRSLIYSELNKELYNKFSLTAEERQACKNGYIYIHDKSARRDTIKLFVA